MRRIAFSALTIVAVLVLMGYASGFFTGEVRKEDSCLLCRATRYSGEHYGFAYERIEDNVLTDWYRQNIDPRHGLDAQHPHQWEQSGCTVVVDRGLGATGYSCIRVAPVFLLRPEIQLEVLKNIRDKQTQVALLRSLTSPDYRLNARRVRVLIEWYYIYRTNLPWDRWWQSHASEFGIQVSGSRKSTINL